MLRYCILFSMAVSVCAVGCKNNQIVGDPFGSTRIPPPTTNGLMAAPAPAAAPYYSQPPAGQVMPGQSILSQPGSPAANNGLVPVPSSAPGTTYPGATPAPTYPQNGPLYPNNSGATVLPHRTNLLAGSPSNVVQPVSHQPRLQPVPPFGGAEPKIRIEEPSLRKIAVVEDDSPEADVFAEEKPKQPVFRKPRPQLNPPSLIQPQFEPQLKPQSLIKRTSHTSVLVKKSKPVQPVSVLSGDSVLIPNSRPSSASNSPRTDVADLPKVEPKPQAKFRAVTSAPPVRYGHAEDYSWLKGKLEYSASRRQWKLRYIPLDGNTDEYGGSVMLDSVDENQYSAGDFVAVRGRLGDRDPEVSDFSTTYHVQQMKSM